MAASCLRSHGVKRVLVPGSLRVYPINEYGAVQTGVHRFMWKISRVSSFEHQAMPSGQ